jgi:hypothetical protein
MIRSLVKTSATHIGKTKENKRKRKQKDMHSALEMEKGSGLFV